MLKLLVIGNLGKDATSNVVNGRTVINFSVAHTEKFKDATGNTKDKTLWVECAYWTDKMGILPYLKKGTQVYVEGNPDMRTYTTQDGRYGSSLILRVINIKLLGIKSNNENATSTPIEPQAPLETFTPVPPVETSPEDDLPF